jgi:tRNA-2-methylthio-N6-dimethylallyladenosine synthase
MDEDFVPDEVIAERFERLRVVVERSALTRYQARVGRAERVLVEGPSRKDPSVLSGRTRQGKITHFVPGSGQTAPAAGSLADVVVTGAAPHHLRAELVAVAAGPRHRSRIPVSIR